MDLRLRATVLVQARWFGYVFGLAAVLLTTGLLVVLLYGRVANISALYTIPVLLTAALYGRGPALWASIAGFFLFDWFFVDAPSRFAPERWPTLIVFLVTAAVAGQLAASLRRQAQEAQQREREALALYEVARLVPGSTLELEPLLASILDQLKTIVGYEAAAVVLQDDLRGAVVVEFRGSVARELVVGLHLRPGSAMTRLLEAVSSRREPVIAERAKTSALALDLVDSGFSMPQALLEDRTELAVPLIVKGRVTGMQTLFRSAAQPYAPRHAELAMVFAQHAAVAIENARLYEQARGKAALEERQRLARELHDSVAQALYSISLNVSSAEELIGAAPERARQLLGDVLRLAEAGMTEMRALIFELRPESLEQEGLVGAIEKQAAAATARHGLHVHLNMPEEPELPLPIKEAFYRVAQEALHNAARHARASSVDVGLEITDGEIRLVVADDGRGFDPRELFPGHLGLRSMRERVTAVGGTLEVDSRPGGPTRVTARLSIY